MFNSDGEPMVRIHLSLSGYQPASEIAAAGGRRSPGDFCGDAAAPISTVPNNQRDRPLANARHPFIAEAPATAAGERTRAGAYRDRAGVPPRTSLVRRGAIDAENAKPNADTIQSSAARAGVVTKSAAQI
jgi:hypothetical protein